MSTPLQENGRLDGWKAISDHLGWHVRTVMRWELQRGLPIHRVPGGQRHAVYAFPQELNEWLKSGQLDDNYLAEDPDSPTKAFTQANQRLEISAIEHTQPGALPGDHNQSRFPVCGQILET